MSRHQPSERQRYRIVKASIDLAGSIQPHGALLVLREPDHVIVQASGNAADFLGISQDIIGHRLDAIEGDLAKTLAPHLRDRLEDLPRGIRCRVGELIGGVR